MTRLLSQNSVRSNSCEIRDNRCPSNVIENLKRKMSKDLSSAEEKRSSKSRKGLLHKAEPESSVEKNRRQGQNKQPSKHDLYSCVEEMRNLLLKTDIPKELPDEELDLFSSIFDVAFTSHASAQGLIPSDGDGQATKGAVGLKGSASAGALLEGQGHVPHEEAVAKGRELFEKAVADGAAWPSKDETPQQRHLGQILQKIGKLQADPDQMSAEGVSEERQTLYKNLYKFKKIAQRVAKIQNAVSAISRMKRAVAASKVPPSSSPSLIQQRQEDAREDSGDDADEETEDEQHEEILTNLGNTVRREKEEVVSSSAECSSDENDDHRATEDD